jgi:hypothetical protein
MGGIKDSGSVVTYTGCCDEQAKVSSVSDPRGVLVEGEKYTIERVEIHNWHTRYWLEGVNCDTGFNSVCFE